MMFRWGRKKLSDKPTSPVRRVGQSSSFSQRPERPSVSTARSGSADPYLDPRAVSNMHSIAIAGNIDPTEVEAYPGNDRRKDSVSRKFIDDLENNEWRGTLPHFVNEANRSQCAVCNMGFRSVRILVTQSHYTSGQYQSMVAELKKKHYTIETETFGSAAAIAKVYEFGSQKTKAFSQSGVGAEDAGYQELYDDVIAGAYRLQASDIHCEMDNDGESVIRLRIFGRMRLWKRYSTELLLNAVSSGYMSRTKAGTNSGGNFSIERGMSTMTKHKIGGVTIEGRFSSLPTNNGGDVVIRLLVSDPAKQTRPTLEQLGYAPSQIAEISGALLKNSGLVSIAGSTGSGKTTSLGSFMDMLPRKAELKRVSIEDPVEYSQVGVRKFSIQRGPDDPDEVVKAKFLATLRQQMRMDPDAIMIGEIRDYESGSIASEFVQTGHRVLTTIHGDGCVDALARAAGELIKIPTEILAMRKFITASIYQKLVPVLCDCKVRATDVLSEEHIRLLKEKFHLDPGKMYCANEEGCEQCRIPEIEHSGGTVGQTVCAEVLITNAEIRDAIRLRDWNRVERLWRGQRRSNFDDPDMEGKTAFEHALYKASVGMVDIRDIENDFELLSTYEIFDMHPQTKVLPMQAA